MDRFIARENIRHYRDLLHSDLDAGTRARLHTLLVEEEDKLAKDVELLADIERHIADGHRRIEAQRLRVATMRANGHHRVEQAEVFLDGMIESQAISIIYREVVAAEIERNRLIG